MPVLIVRIIYYLNGSFGLEAIGEYIEDKMKKNIFKSAKTASQSNVEMTHGQLDTIESLSKQIDVLRAQLESHSDTWVVASLQNAINELNDVLVFLRSKY